jgi:hypothetical protein
LAGAFFGAGFATGFGIGFGAVFFAGWGFGSCFGEILAIFGRGAGSGADCRTGGGGGGLKEDEGRAALLLTFGVAGGFALSMDGDGGGAAGGDGASLRDGGGRFNITLDDRPDLADPNKLEEIDSRPLRESPTYPARVMLIPCLAFRI